MNDETGSCPLADVEQRLSDVHRLWHRANSSYFDPDEFRVDLNTLIQMSRTVTFILQKNKAKIPNFDNWYGAHQEQMKADATMRWLVDARNEIEKEGDLTTMSVIRTEIVASHLNEFPSEQVEAHLFDNVDKLFGKVPRFALKAQVLKHGFLEIQRKWVHSKLPNMELLEAIAHCYGVMSKIVADAHKQMQLPVPIISGLEECNETQHIDGRLPCMNSPAEIRTLRVHLADGSRLSMEKRSVEFDFSETKERMIQRYGGLPSATTKGDSTFEKRCYDFFNIGRLLIEKDYYHDPITLLLRGEDECRPMLTPTRDRQEKYLMSRAIADEVRTMGADAVISIGEVWQTELLPQFEYPTDQKQKKEALVLTGVTAQGETLCLSSDIIRTRSRLRRSMKKPEKVTLGPTVTIKSFTPFLLGTVLEAWGLPLRAQNGSSDSSTPE